MANISVRLPNGELQPMSYPDDWTDEQVKDAIYKNFPEHAPENKSEIESTPFNNRPEPKQERTGFTGLASDAIDMVSNAFKGGMGYLESAPKELENLGGEILKSPLKAEARATGELGSGAAKLAKSLFNSPHDFLKYMLKKNLALDIPIPGTKLHTSDIIPHIPEVTGVENALGLEPKNKTEEFLQQTPGVVAAAMGIGKGITKGFQYLKGPSKDILMKRAIEDQLQQARKEHGLSEEGVQKLKEQLTKDYYKIHRTDLGEVSPTGQQVAIYKKEQDVNALKPSTEIPEKNVGEIPEAPDTRQMIDESKTAEKTAKEELLRHTLKVKENPTLKAGANIQTAIKNLRDKSSALYNKARSIYKDKQVLADNTKEIKEVTDELNYLKDNDELAPGYGAGTAEQKALETQIESLKGEKVNASDLLDLQRTLEKMAKDTRKKQFSGTVSDQEATALGKRAERLDLQAEKVAKHLEPVGGEEVQALIKQANKGWKAYKHVSAYNTVGKRAYFKGDVPNNAMITIARNETGNEFLNALVKSDPELKRQILASHVGESSADKLLDPTDLTKSYLKDLPEVADKVQALQSALKNTENTTKSASRISKAHRELVKSMKDAAKEQETRNNAIRDTSELKKQIKFHERAIPKLEAKIKITKEKGESVEKLENELKMHRRAMEDKNNKLKQLVHKAVHLTGITTLGHKIGL